MAYRRYFAAVDPSDVDRYRRWRGRRRLRPTKIASSSNLLTYEPSVLGAMIEDAEPLGEWLWHPLRSPVYVAPEQVSRWLKLLETWASEVLEHAEEAGDDWTLAELAPTLDVCRYAARNNHGVISALEPPRDRDRAQRVAMPFKIRR